MQILNQDMLASVQAGLDKQRSLENYEKLNRATDGTHSEGDSELKEAFTEFVGQTLFGQLLKSMRSTVGKPAYMHGGRTEEIFQAQLDAIITQDLTDSSASQYADPMYDLFTMNRQL